MDKDYKALLLITTIRMASEYGLDQSAARAAYAAYLRSKVDRKGMQHKDVLLPFGSK